jgi:hypothetical protein
LEDRAVSVYIGIMRAFVRQRRILSTNANYGEARTGQEKDWLSSERAAQPIYGLSKKETPNITSAMQILLSFETLNSGGIKEYQD